MKELTSRLSLESKETERKEKSISGVSSNSSWSSEGNGIKMSCAQTKEMGIDDVNSSFRQVLCDMNKYLEENERFAGQLKKQRLNLMKTKEKILMLSGQSVSKLKEAKPTNKLERGIGRALSLAKNPKKKEK